MIVIKNIVNRLVKLERITKPDTIKDPIVLKIFTEQQRDPRLTRHSPQHCIPKRKTVVQAGTKIFKKSDASNFHFGRRV